MNNNLGLNNLVKAEEELNTVKAEIDYNINKSDHLLDEADHIVEKIIVQESLIQNRNIKNDQIEFMIRSLQSSCLGLNISIESLQVSPYLNMEKTPSSNFSVAQIALEDGAKLFENILNTIKDLFTWIWNNLKVFFTKLINSTDALVQNITELITHIEQSSKTKIFKTLTREQFKSVVSRAPVIFILGNDPNIIKKALSSSVHLDISADILKDIETYSRALMVDPNIDILVFTNEVNTAVEQILKTQSQHIYNNLVTKISELNELNRKGRVTIYRADGRKIKYRYLSPANDVSGIKTLNIQNRSYTLSRKDEDLISINKIFRPDEISALLRNVASYISSVNTTQNAIKDKINRAQNLTKQIEEFAKQNNLKSGVYLLAFNNYYKLLKLLLTNIATDTILSNYETAKNVYFACNKYIKLALDETTISKESFTEYTENDDLILDYNELPEVFEIQIDEDGMNEDLLEDGVDVSQEGWMKTLEEKLTFHGMSHPEWIACKLAMRILKWTTRHIKFCVDSNPLSHRLIISERGIRRLQGELDDKEQYDRLFTEFCSYRDSLYNQKTVRTYRARDFFEHIALSAIRSEKDIALGLRNAHGVIQKSGSRPFTPEEKRVVDQFNKTYQPMITEAITILKVLMPDLF